MVSTAATRMAVGTVSLLDCPALTWSFGWMDKPVARWATRATTSLTFMLVEVPEPVWKTSMGNWSSCFPRATSSAAVAMALAMAGSTTDSSALTQAAAALIRASAWMIGRGMVSPEMGKFSTARAVWAPHSASAGTSTSPIESCSVRPVLPESVMTASWPRSAAQSLRNLTRRTLWSSSLDSTRLARPRVVTTLSTRFRSLIESQMPMAVSRACSSVSPA